MRNIISILAILLAASCFSSVSAQKLEQYEWKQYKITFKAPEKMEIVENSATRFEGETKDLSLEIEILDYEDATSDDLAEFLISMGEDYGLEDAEDAEVETLSFGGWEGLCLEGSITDEVTMCVVLLLDPKSDLALGIKIFYFEGKQKLCANVINSFRKKP